MHLAKALCALAPAIILAACGGGDDIDDRLDVADPQVRFVHAIPIGPAVTLFRNDVAQADATSAGYKFASPYFDVETGPAVWRVNTDVGNVQIGAPTSIDAKRGNRYTMIAVPGSPNGDLMLIDDPFNKGLTSDNARVRAVNASFNAQNIDVYLTPPTVDLAGVAPNFASVGYKAAMPPSGDDSAELPGGSYQLRITPAGTKTVIFSAPVTLANDADWLVMTVPGDISPNAIRVLLVLANDPGRTTQEIASQ
jgi:hypothetical protein